MTTPTLRQALPVWARIGCLSFGGPAAQIALMHREVVEQRSWLSETRFLNALSFCMLLPGPEAMQLATYCGWRMNGIWGGLIAGLLFVIPGAIVIAALAALYLSYGQVPVIQALFLGVKAAVFVIVIEALLKVAGRAFMRRGHLWLAIAAFVALFAFALPYPLVIAVAAILGVLIGSPVQADAASGVAPVRWTSTLKTIALWLAIWMLPLFAIELAYPDSVFPAIGRFFSVLAMVTFGGAYAVLAYMGQAAVETNGWLTAAEMADALGLAETTPGPLILVTEFVGFLAGARGAGGGVMAGLAGAMVALWATFAPCFLWVFAGAPYIDRLQSMPRLRGALAGITAAVVGVIANLSLWFAMTITFDGVSRLKIGPAMPWVPDLATLDWRVPVLAAVAAAMLLWKHQGVGRTLLVCAVLGWGLSLI